MEVKIFENKQFDKLKEISKQSPFIGYIYILEWGDNKVKIGCTTNPGERIKSLNTTAKYADVEIGRVAIIGTGHTNFTENEKRLHSYFSNRRVDGTELFDICFDEIITNVPEIYFEDKSDEMEERIKSINDFGMKYISGYYDVEVKEKERPFMDVFHDVLKKYFYDIEMYGAMTQETLELFEDTNFLLNMAIHITKEWAKEKKMREAYEVTIQALMNNMPTNQCIRWRKNK